MFTNINRQVNLQYKSQTAMAQFQQYFMGANGGVCKDGDSYYIADKESGKIYSLTYFKEDESDEGIIYLGEADKNSVITNDYVMERGSQIFCSGVRYDYNLSTTPKSRNDGIKVAVAVTVTLPLVDGNKSYVATQNFKFRNEPVFVASPAMGDRSKLETLVKEV